MKVQDEIFKWVRKLELWKQELFIRASASPELSPQDVSEITAMLLGEVQEGGGPREVTREDLPGAEGADQRMIIRALSDLQNVNVIAEGQALAFEPEGLNLVFGKNGAGKTGYSRILKHAGRTLHRETVLANVTGSPAKPEATIAISIGKVESDIPLDLESPAPALLGRICVADSKAGEAYLTSATEVDYAPAALNSVRRLAEGLIAVEEELGRRLHTIRPDELDLRPYGEQTEVAQLLGGLSSATPDDLIIAISTLSPEETEEFERLRRQRGEIEAKQAPKLRQAAERDVASASKLIAALDALAGRLRQEKVVAAREEHTALIGMRQAAEVAARGFGDEPIVGVGTGPWRALWQAAREFAQHQGDQLPSDHDPTHCPLCMQELAPEARDRLRRFEQFITDDVNERLRKAELAHTTTRDALPDIAAIGAAHADILERLGTDPGQPGCLVSEWLDRAEALVVHLRAAEFDGLQDVEALPPELKAWIAARGADVAHHAALEQAEDQKRLRRDLAELAARSELARRREEILTRLAALRDIAGIEAAKTKLGKAAVSRKMTAFAGEIVTTDLQDALTSQLEALDFHGLEVEAKPKTVAGKPMVGLRFKTVDKAPLTSVLSQGEQRRLALAMFLAEMEVLPGDTPVVLDDPVSSIDQEGRRHVARTLARLAADRQVIVFTHELSFIHELRRNAPDDVPVHVQHVMRDGKTVGHVRPSLPWEGLGPRDRIGPLRDRLRDLKKIYEAGHAEEYDDKARRYCSLLRESFERTVEDRVLASVIVRRTDDVHTKKLRQVNCTAEICDLVDRGMSDSSPWVHDQPLTDGADPPTPDELREGLELYVELLDKLKAADDERIAETKKRKNERTSRLKAVESGRAAVEDAPARRLNPVPTPDPNSIDPAADDGENGDERDSKKPA